MPSPNTITVPDARDAIREHGGEFALHAVYRPEHVERVLAIRNPQIREIAINGIVRLSVVLWSPEEEEEACGDGSLLIARGICRNIGRLLASNAYLTRHERDVRHTISAWMLRLWERHARILAAIEPTACGDLLRKIGLPVGYDDTERYDIRTKMLHIEASIGYAQTRPEWQLFRAAIDPEISGLPDEELEKLAQSSDQYRQAIDRRMERVVAEHAISA